ncbi:MAG TPA: hypothetical protein VN253_04585 [Kofleriaceae bacterium]|nr:hypothetical protein [Kofleriaceae bacterium]
MPSKPKHAGGRPPRDPSGATVPWSLRLTPAQLERAERSAAAAGMSVRDWAVRAIDEASAEDGGPRFETLEDALSYVRAVPDGAAFEDLVDRIAPVLLARAHLASVISALWPSRSAPEILAALAAHAKRRQRRR